MQKITKEDLMLVREIVTKISSDDIKDGLKKIPDEKRAYLLNYLYELVVDENKEEYILNDEEIKKHK